MRKNLLNLPRGFGEPLRRFFSEKAWVRSVVDFGHAKQIPKVPDKARGEEGRAALIDLILRHWAG